MLRSGIINILIISFVTSTATGQCPQPVVVIKKGEVAVCDGFLFSPEAEKRAATARDDAKYYKELTDKLFERQDLATKERDILERRLNLYVEQSRTLSEALTKKQHEDFWQKALYFGLGAVITGGVAYGVVKTLK